MPRLWADSLDGHRALVRRRLVDAFAQLVRERPLDDITVAAVAERADMARSAVYNHVAHLHDLALWYSEEVLDAWLAEITEDTVRHTANARLELFIRRSFDVFAEGRTNGMDLARRLDADRLARLFALLRPVEAHLEAIIADGMEAGEFAGRDPAVLLPHVWAVLSGYRTAIEEGRVDGGVAADAVVVMLRCYLTEPSVHGR